MTQKASTDGDQCSTNYGGMWKFVLALLLLRLCIGWHFFSEGTKKLTYHEGRQEWQLTVPTEVVFRNATGPFADFFKNQVPGFYDWENLLAKPTQFKPLDSETLAKRQAWASDYASRRRSAEQKKEPVPIEFPPEAPYTAWAENIVAGLRGKLEAFNALSGLDESQTAAAAEVFVARHQQLADFLATEEEAIHEYQHELWRLENLEAEPGADEIPFRQDRVAEKRAETTGLGAKLVSEVRGIERGFENDLLGVLTAEQRADESFSDKVEATLTDPKARRMQWLNVAVTCLIIGVGVCLLIGLFTRLATLGGMVFLLTVMVTQLPWVPGADTKFFYYQLVEFTALLALLACGPWRLPSLDGLLRSACSKCCGAKR